MTHEERKVVVALAIALLVNGYFAFVVVSGWQAGRYAGADGLTVWARSVIWLIPASIVLNILAAIALAVLPGGDKTERILDERDRLIRVRGLVIVFLGTVVGVLAALTVLALGGTALVAMTLIMAGCALGDLTSLVTKLTLYRKGL